ncbi:hypothetical protein KGI01_08400 [Kurthia gibsonii]|nr:hypothetical protein KGI01_08400 [Kurthia gibsonii]
MIVVCPKEPLQIMTSDVESAFVSYQTKSLLVYTKIFSVITYFLNKEKKFLIGKKEAFIKKLS